ncbi:MAG: SIS domain-containing protein [Sulfolobales archaeon]
MPSLTHKDLYRIYLSWPEKILEALTQETENCYQKAARTGKIVIAGIGGSGAPGRILEAYSVDSGRPPHVWSVSGVYIDPRLDLGDAVAICVSYSGTTMETIRIFDGLSAKGVGIGVVTSGGRLLEIAVKRSIPLYRLSPGSLPRLELPTMMVGIAKISKCLGAPLGIEDSLKEASSILARDRKDIEELGREIADKVLKSYLEGKRIAIAATQPYYPLIHRIRSELSENASLPSEPIEIPEMGHNQVASLRSGRGSLVINIVDRDREEDLAVEGYFRRLSEIYPEIEVAEISPPQGVSYIAKALYISMVAGIATSILGMDRGLDPSNIPEIRLFREIMYSYYGSS